MMLNGVHGDRMCVGGTHLYNLNKPMTNQLTLVQLHSMSGAGTETHWNPKLRDAKRNYNLKQLADSGQLVKKMKYIPGKMVCIIPGDMYWWIISRTAWLSQRDNGRGGFANIRHRRGFANWSSTDCGQIWWSVDSEDLCSLAAQPGNRKARHSDWIKNIQIRLTMSCAVADWAESKLCRQLRLKRRSLARELPKNSHQWHKLPESPAGQCHLHHLDEIQAGNA